MSIDTNIIGNIRREDLEVLKQLFQNIEIISSINKVMILKYYDGVSGKFVEFAGVGFSLVLYEHGVLEHYDDNDNIKEGQLMIRIDGTLPNTPEDWKERSEYIELHKKDIEKVIIIFDRKRKIKNIITDYED